MSRRWWRRALSGTAAAVAVAVTVLVWLRYDFEKVSWTWGVLGGVFGTFVVVRQVVRDRDANRGAPALQRRAVAEELAELVRRNPVDETLLKSLDEPYPLPVAWVNAPEIHQPSWRTICRSSEGGPLDLSGRDGGIHDSFRRIPSGRMMVLGPAGSGKSVLAMRLARRLVAERSADGPIPVLLYVASWDAASTHFDRWVVSQIANRYPRLAAAHPRWAEALRDLLDANVILPILDGLDETTEERAALCLRRLNELPTRRLVLTCRTGFYNRYLQQGEKLRGAAVVAIEPLDPAKVADYLLDAAPLAQVARWRPVIEEILRGGESELTAALSTPLMVAMARTAFDERASAVQVDPSRVDPAEADPPDNDPGILVGLARDGGRQAVEDSLLSEAVEGAIRPYRESWLSSWSPAATRRYLSFLAGHLEGQQGREFVWWRLPTEVPGTLWVLFDALRAALAAWITLVLAGDVLRPLAAAADNRVLRDVLGAATGHSGSLAVLVGVAGAVWSLNGGRDARQGVPPTRIAFRGGVRALGRGLLYGLLFFAFWVGLLRGLPLVYAPVGGIVTFLAPYAVPVDSWPDDLRVAVTVGLASWCYVAVRRALRIDFAAPADRFAVTDPLRVFRDDRSATVLALLPTVTNAMVVVVLLLGALSRSGLAPAVPLDAQVVAGVGVGVGQWILARSGGAWVRFVLARLVLGVTGQLPHRLLEFLSAVASAGLLRDLGGTYRFRHDRLQNLLAALGGRPRAAHHQEEFATELAGAGYWDEALAILGTLLAERAGRPGSDPLLAAVLRKVVFVGCAGGRWWRTGQRLLAVLALYPPPEVPRAPAVTARRREISELVRQGATPERLLTACEALIEAEVAAGRPEPASREFRATLHYLRGDLATAGARLDELLDREYTGELAHAAPVGAALRTRIALEHGDVERAIAGCRQELLLTGISPHPGDVARLAESWWWSVAVLARAADELAEQYRRLREGAWRSGHGTRWRAVRLTGREWAELGLLACRGRLTDPMLGGLATAVARGLVDVLGTPELFRLTVDRSAPMWSDPALPPPDREEDEAPVRG
ncbi:NACHT domain-containing protein [Plantactinospora sp. CA-290183]|uniref:NACHT domain-containing protein n=1 Tax=Plantactinospora sp. CA-290183 TaxID=3240006 RepID=UPI003D8AF5D8